MPTTLSPADSLFLDRVAAKMLSSPDMTMALAAQAVCDDDVRLVKTIFQLREPARNELIAKLSEAVYTSLTAPHGTG